MKIERISIQACCGRTGLIFKIDQPISKDLVSAFEKLGFIQTDFYLTAGLLYINNLDFTISGPLGTDRLTVKCKHAECTEKLNDLEVLIQNLG